MDNNVPITGMRDVPHIADFLVSALSLPFNRHIKTAEQRTIIEQYTDWYTGR